MTTTRIPPSRSATETLWIAISMKSAWRKFSFSITTPCGSVRCRSSSTRSVSRVSVERVRPRLLLDAQDHGRLGAIGRRAAGGLGRRARPTRSARAAAGSRPRPGARVLARSALERARPRPRTRYSWPASTWKPAAGTALAASSAATTSSTEIPACTTAAGSSSTRYSRTSPPIGTTCEIPGTASRLRRTTVSAEPPQLHRRHAVGGERDERDLAHDRADRSERGPLDAARQVHRLQALGDDLAREIDVLAPLELDPDDRDPRPRDGADAPHAGGAVERRLDREGDEQLELLGRQPLRLGDDGDGGRGEVGEDVDRKAARSGRRRRRAAAAAAASTAQRWRSEPRMMLIEHRRLLSGRGLRERPRRAASCAGRRPRRA